MEEAEKVENSGGRSQGTTSRDATARLRIGGRFLRLDDAARFWSKVDKAGPVSELVGTACWVWTGMRTRDGYGRFRLTVRPGQHRHVKAHRWAWQTAQGQPVPDGLTLDHLCRRPACVRPDHLEPVELAENIRRAHRARRHKEGNTQ